MAFVNEQSERDFHQFLTAWKEHAPDLRALFVEIVRRLETVSGMMLDFHAHDHAGNSLRALLPGLHRPLVALLEISDETDSPDSFAIRFYEDTLDDPRELGDWIPRGLLGEDARSFSIGRNQPALADYVLAQLSSMLSHFE